MPYAVLISSTLQAKSHKNGNFAPGKSVITSFYAFSLSPSFVYSLGSLGGLCVQAHVCVCVSCEYLV